MNASPLIAVAQAQELIDLHAGPLVAEAVSLGDVHGRTLREPIASAEDLPPFDCSTMDGYAIRQDDAADAFEIVGEIRAGQAVDRELKPGEAMRIFTGARLPGPGLAVVMQEDVDAREGRIRLVRRSGISHVRKQGEDARAGQVLLEAGITLDATGVALLASVGKTSIQVSRRLRILHITTGDEIVAPGQALRDGQIRNSNASLISALCREQGVETVTHIHGGDDLPALLKIVSEAKAEAYDVVLISGGAGGGDYDFSGELFGHLGAVIHFRGVAVRPGKPLIFGTASRGHASQVVFGLPGNVLSHFVCFHLFVRRALDRLLARPVCATTSGFLAESMTDTRNARETWWPAQAEVREGRLEIRALPWNSSGDITRLPATRALIKVPASTSQLVAGTMVEVLLTRPFF